MDEEFRGPKTIEDTNIYTEEYVQWLEARVADLVQKLEQSRKRSVDLAARLEANRQYQSRKARWDQDHLEYDDRDDYR